MIKLQDCRLTLCPAAQWRSVDHGHRTYQGACRGWWRLTPDSTLPATRPALREHWGVCIPNRPSKSPERKREQKKRWFRDAKNGAPGMQRWLALGVISTSATSAGR